MFTSGSTGHCAAAPFASMAITHWEEAEPELGLLCECLPLARLPGISCWILLDPALVGSFGSSRRSLQLGCRQNGRQIGDLGFFLGSVCHVPKSLQGSPRPAGEAAHASTCMLRMWWGVERAPSGYWVLMSMCNVTSNSEKRGCNRAFGCTFTRKTCVLPCSGRSSVKQPHGNSTSPTTTRVDRGAQRVGPHAAGELVFVCDFI